MSVVYKKLAHTDVDKIITYFEILNDYKVDKKILESRIAEMFMQNYECIAFYLDEKIIGMCGLWFMTRHYVGKSIEVDHFYIEDAHRNKGYGKDFFKWLYNYAENKEVKTIELNTYVTNHPSHKFYYNEGFNILGYHFLKKL
jgi:GNAT superfamily N-acetyltransferase